MAFEKKPADFDWNSFVQESNKKPCFLCRVAAGDPAYPHHILYEDDLVVAFLDKYPRQYGHTLVAPKCHVEHALADFSLEEYVAFQRRLYRIGRVLQASVPTERLYVICYGSMQGFSHVHWQLVPLPPGVPFEKQQGFATSPLNGILSVEPAEMERLARHIRGNLECEAE